MSFFLLSFCLLSFCLFVSLSFCLFYLFVFIFLSFYLSHWPCALIFMDDCTRTMEQSLTPVHGWLHKDNEAPSSPIAQGSMTVRLLPMSDKVTMESVYKPCLTGESPQLLASSPALHISTSTNTFYNLSRSVTDKKATSNCFPLAINLWPDMLQV